MAGTFTGDLLQFIGTSIGIVLTYQVLVIGLQGILKGRVAANALIILIFDKYYYAGFIVLPVFCISAITNLLNIFLSEAPVLLNGYEVVRFFHLCTVFLVLFGWIFILIMIADLFVTALKVAKIR